MKLREFIEILEGEKFKVHKDQYFVNISWKGTPCARVSLTTFADCWINNGQIKDREVCAVLNRTVSAFANTSLNDRNEKVVAKHANGSYVKEVTLLMMGKPALRVEMTNNYTEANDGISSLEREWLNNFFGDKISYIEEY